MKKILLVLCTLISMSALAKWENVQVSYHVEGKETPYLKANIKLAKEEFGYDTLKKIIPELPKMEIDTITLSIRKMKPAGYGASLVINGKSYDVLKQLFLKNPAFLQSKIFRIISNILKFMDKFSKLIFEKTQDAVTFYRIET